MHEGKHLPPPRRTSTRASHLLPDHARPNPPPYRRCRPSPGITRHNIKATHPRPFFLSLNAEMEDEVDTTAGSGQTAADFRDFYRHVV
ncbi:MAG: hypothetical protein M3Q27_09570, partial [Actinomycetota bacterium]|nr:hypothetical protein [Actinomycetota bacterium]